MSTAPFLTLQGLSALDKKKEKFPVVASPGNLNDDFTFFLRLLSLGQNVIAYGFGSKITILRNFVEFVRNRTKVNNISKTRVAACFLDPRLPASTAITRIWESLQEAKTQNESSRVTQDKQRIRYDLQSVHRIIDELTPPSQSLQKNKRPSRKIPLSMILVLPNVERAVQLFELLTPLIFLDTVALFGGIDHCRAVLAWTAEFMTALEPMFLHLPTLIKYSVDDLGYITCGEDNDEGKEVIKSYGGRCTHIASAAYESLPAKKKEAFAVLAKLCVKEAPKEFPGFTSSQLVTAVGVKETKYRQALRSQWLVSETRQRAELYEELQDQGLVALEGNAVILLVCMDCLQNLLGADFMSEEENSSSS